MKKFFKLVWDKYFRWGRTQGKYFDSYHRFIFLNYEVEVGFQIHFVQTAKLGCYELLLKRLGKDVFPPEDTERIALKARDTIENLAIGLPLETIEIENQNMDRLAPLVLEHLRRLSKFWGVEITGVVFKYVSYARVRSQPKR